MLKSFAVFLLMASQIVQADVQLSESLYLGEVKTISVEAGSSAQQLNWQVHRDSLKKIAAEGAVEISPHVTPGSNRVDLRLAAYYISPSFQNLQIQITGVDPNLKKEAVRIQLNLSVRAELVIRFRHNTRNLQDPTLPPHLKSVFEWDIPVDAKTGDYLPIKVSNHPKGLWVRFRLEDKNLLRPTGYLIHIYRGPGEYIVHQPLDKPSHLMKSGCPLEPISMEEWKDPAQGVNANGKSWIGCEFRGFVPAGTAYGFGFREHYLESEGQQKSVTIENVTSLDTYLVELYKFYEQLGVGFSVLCSQW